MRQGIQEALRSRSAIAGIALLVVLLSACAPVCPHGETPRVVPCQTVVIHRVVGAWLTVDRPVTGWSVRFGSQVIPLDPKGVSIPLSGGGPPEGVVLEGPRGEKLTLPPAAVGGQGDPVKSQVILPGEVPATVSVAWQVATDVSECHGAPPTTRCESRS